MRFSPENIRGQLGNIRDKAKEVWGATKYSFDVMNRNRATTGSVLLGITLGGGLVYGILGVYGPWIAEQNAIEAAKTAEAKQAVADALRRDFEETSGANLIKGESNSMAVTLRESASLAGSRIELLTGVWDRIHRETGCDIGSTTYLEPVPAFPWGQKEPGTYTVTLANCPPNRVQSSQ